VKLDVVCCKKRGERAIDIARAIHIPVTMIRTALKSAQAVETKAIKPKVKITCQRCDVMDVLKWHLAACPHKPSSHGAESCKIV
jgi:hypothetical protein